MISLATCSFSHLARLPDLMIRQLGWGISWRSRRNSSANIPPVAGSGRKCPVQEEWWCSFPFSQQTICWDKGKVIWNSSTRSLGLGNPAMTASIWWNSSIWISRWDGKSSTHMLMCGCGDGMLEMTSSVLRNPWGLHRGGCESQVLRLKHDWLQIKLMV